MIKTAGRNPQDKLWKHYLAWSFAIVGGSTLTYGLSHFLWQRWLLNFLSSLSPNEPSRSTSNANTLGLLSTSQMLSPVCEEEFKMSIIRGKHPLSAALKNGNVVVAWMHDVGAMIYAGLYDAQGNVLVEATQINGYNVAYRHEPFAIAALANNRVVIAWSGFCQDCGESSNIYARLYDESFVAMGPEFKASSYTGNSPQWLPTISASPSGGFVMAWNSHGQNAGLDIYAQIHNENGEKIGAEIPVNSYITGTQGRPTVNVFANEEFLVTWESFNQHGDDGFSIRAQRFSPQGVKIETDTDFLVSTRSQVSEWYSTIAGSSTNTGAIIAWKKGSLMGYYGIYARRYNSANELGDIFRVSNQATSYSQENPFALSLPNNASMIIWEGLSESEDIPGTVGDVQGIYAQLFDADAQPFGHEFQLDNWTENTKGEGFHVTLMSDGRILAVWDHELWNTETERFESNIFGKFCALPEIPLKSSSTSVPSPSPTPLSTSLATTTATPHPTPLPTSSPTPLSTSLATTTATPHPTPLPTPSPTPLSTSLATTTATPHPTPSPTPLSTSLATTTPLPESSFSESSRPVNLSSTKVKTTLFGPTSSNNLSNLGPTTSTVQANVWDTKTILLVTALTAVTAALCIVLVLYQKQRKKLKTKERIEAIGLVPPINHPTRRFEVRQTPGAMA